MTKLLHVSTQTATQKFPLYSNGTDSYLPLPIHLTHHCHTPDVSLSSAHPQLSPTRTVAPLYATYPTICHPDALLHPDLLPFAQCTTCNLPNAANPHCHCTATLRPLRSGHSTESSSRFQPPHDTLPTSHSLRVPFTRMLEIPQKQLPAPGESEQNALP
jgi:hypothetical protein